MRVSIVHGIAVSLVGMFAVGQSFADTPGPHPAYLHALSDLRDARAHLEHQGNDPADHEEESAIGNIDKALDDIKKAAIDDGKNIRDHVPVDAHLQRRTPRCAPCHRHGFSSHRFETLAMFRPHRGTQNTA